MTNSSTVGPTYVFDEIKIKTILNSLSIKNWKVGEIIHDFYFQLPYSFHTVTTLLPSQQQPPQSSQQTQSQFQQQQFNNKTEDSFNQYIDKIIKSYILKGFDIEIIKTKNEKVIFILLPLPHSTSIFIIEINGRMQSITQQQHPSVTTPTKAKSQNATSMLFNESSTTTSANLTCSNNCKNRYIPTVHITYRIANIADILSAALDVYTDHTPLTPAVLNILKSVLLLPTSSSDSSTNTVNSNTTNAVDNTNNISNSIPTATSIDVKLYDITTFIDIPILDTSKIHNYLNEILTEQPGNAMAVYNKYPQIKMLQKSLIIDTIVLYITSLFVKPLPLVNTIISENIYTPDVSSHATYFNNTYSNNSLHSSGYSQVSNALLTNSHVSNALLTDSQVSNALLTNSQESNALLTNNQFTPANCHIGLIDLVRYVYIYILLFIHFSIYIFVNGIIIVYYLIFCTL